MFLICSIWKNMSLDDILNLVEWVKLVVWDYLVSNKYIKLWEIMKLLGFFYFLEEVFISVKNGIFVYIGKYRGRCRYYRLFIYFYLW